MRVLLFLILLLACLTLASLFLVYEAMPLILLVVAVLILVRAREWMPRG